MNEPAPRSPAESVELRLGDFEGARQLQALAEIERLTRALLDAGVAAARREGATWPQIAEATGVDDPDRRWTEPSSRDLHPEQVAAVRLSNLAAGVALSVLRERDAK